MFDYEGPRHPVMLMYSTEILPNERTAPSLVDEALLRFYTAVSLCSIALRVQQCFIQKPTNR